MDFFDECIFAALRDGKPKDFTKFLEEVGFSHNTAATPRVVNG